VTFAGVALPGATLDRWEDDGGRAWWSARVVSRSGTIPDEGELVGRTTDGRFVSGHCVVGDRQVGEGARRETLIEFHGDGELSVTTEPATAQGS
jgi:hypothetical protein